MLFFLPFFLVADVTHLAKVLGFLGWIAAALFQYGFFRYALSVNKPTATVIALCGLSAPFFPFCGELTYNMYVLAVALFWLAWLVTGMRIAGTVDGILVRAAAVALFSLSFELNSHIAHLYAIAVFLLLYHIDKLEMPRLHQQAATLLARYWELAILPVAYWTWKNTFTPTSGYYATYNSLKLSPLTITKHYAIFLADVPLYLSRSIYASGAIVCAALVMILVLNTIWRKRCEGLSRLLTPKRPLRLFVAAAFLFLCSVFSYCAVDQPVLFDGWAARNTILVNVPFAIMLVSGSALITRWDARYRWLLLSVPIVIFVVSGCMACNRTTLRWQGFGAKQLAVRDAVRTLLDAQVDDQGRHSVVSVDAVNVVHLRDYFILPGTLPWYPAIVWTYMIAPESAEPTVFVVDSRLWLADDVRAVPDGRQYAVPPTIRVDPTDLRGLLEQTTQPYALTKVPHSGRTLNLAVMPGDQGTDGVRIGLEYLRLRYLDPDSLDRYVRSVAKVMSYQ